jgi:hypothetical protein
MAESAIVQIIDPTFYLCRELDPLFCAESACCFICFDQISKFPATCAQRLPILALHTHIVNN